MESSPALQLLGLLLITALLGALIGGSLVRLVLLKRLQRRYDRWRRGVNKEIRSLSRGQDERESLQTRLRLQAGHIASLEAQLSRFEVVLPRSADELSDPYALPEAPIEQNQVEQGQVEQDQVEQGQVEQGQVEQGQVEQGQVEQGQVEQGQVEQGQVEQGQVEQGQVEQGEESDSPAPDETDDDGVPVLTRQVELKQRIYRGQKLTVGR